MISKDYSYHLDIYPNEISAFSFNDFLVFSATYQNNGIISALLFFGYPNGTDFNIEDFTDFEKFLNKVNPIGTSENDNLYIFLNNRKKIENNIFGYAEVDKINLVSIPKEILFYQTSEDGTKEIGIPLTSNSLFGVNHVLKPNLQLKRSNNFYYLYYQYIVKEADPLSGNSKLYYGRTNSLGFKLCKEPVCEPECSFESYLNKECLITGTNEEIIESVKKIISLYEDYKKILSIEVTENTYVEITNDKKEELLDDDGNLAKLDLGDCGKKIRETFQN